VLDLPEARINFVPRCASSYPAFVKRLNLALVGFGNVNRALVGHLDRKAAELRDGFNLEYQVTGVFSRRLGFLADANGLDTMALLEDRKLELDPVASYEAWLEAAKPDVVFEASSLDPYTGQPAIDYCRLALERAAHVVTANKGPIVHAFRELDALAKSKGVRFLFEATFMGGSPIYSLFRETLPTAKLLQFRGLPNATSTVVLNAIETGSSYDEGIRKAQDMGIAETDPSYDVDGWDSTVKVIGLANVLMGSSLGIDDVERKSIRSVPDTEIQAAFRANTPYRLVATIWRDGETADGKVRASVKPEKLEPSDPLRAATGADMFAYFKTDVLPGLTVIAHDGDAHTTAYDMLCDFVTATRA
jgi:homoserine dehydrogenase